LSRIAGRNARLYMNITSGGTAEPIAFISTFELNQASDRFDVTAFGDSNKTYVAGLPDASGSFNGWYDNATAQTYTAASDGVARKFYFYPDNTNTAQYWFGTAFFDFSVQTGVDGGAAVSGNWNAATIISKVG
jgi:hypothetical protein